MEDSSNFTNTQPFSNFNEQNGIAENDENTCVINEVNPKFNSSEIR